MTATTPDETREVEIREAIDAMNAEPDRIKARQHWERAQRLINARSPEQVARMERERGLV